LSSSSLVTTGSGAATIAAVAIAEAGNVGTALLKITNPGRLRIYPVFIGGMAA